MKPNLSKIMKTKADLVEGKRKLVETENEWKEKLQETRDAVDSEMTDVHDNTRGNKLVSFICQSISLNTCIVGQHSAHGFTANKYDFIQDVVSKINDPAFVGNV
jgi:hypothetical protein